MYTRNDIIAKDEQITLTIALFALPITYREVIILYYYQELKVREIADILLCAENTVKTRLRRARKMLQSKLNPSDWEVLMDDSF
ncbi:sigma-70 family RNA polymerase sigma factor [Lysinibacillus sp. FSL R7-0073]|uniref:sigma-70 family RNA polymerase sigma factor n=1 Tax=Lysinibacillus TaxID=400634 RepID=UPI002E1C5338|nr:sigma-70 family RNA polymerase sigma factor [Lysinibacillus fusiformis]